MLCEVKHSARPEALQISGQVELDNALENSYERMKRDGWGFSADLLPTGEVTATIERGFNDFLDVKVVPNQTETLRRAFETMLMRCFPCRGRDLQHTMERPALHEYRQ